MICSMVPFPVTLSDPEARFQGHDVIFRLMSALNVLCEQLMRDLFAIAKFLFSPLRFYLLSKKFYLRVLLYAFYSYHLCNEIFFFNCKFLCCRPNGTFTDSLFTLLL